MSTPRKQVSYRVGIGRCITGYLDVDNCEEVNVYGAPVGGAPIAGAVVTPDGDCPTEVIVVAPVVRTAALQSGVSTPGVVAAGAYEVGFRNTGTSSAIVAGGAMSPGEFVSFVTHGLDTLSAIAYTASATGTLTIATVR